MKRVRIEKSISCTLALGLFWLASPTLGREASVEQSTRQSDDDSPPPLRVSNSKTGYIDNAIVGTQIRIRYDAAVGNNRPDRAEFFYGKCGCYRLAGLDPLAPGPVPDNPSPPDRIVETNVDYLDIRLNLEYAFDHRFSFFVEVPFRSLNPEVNEKAFGLGDVQTGVKFAVIASPERYLTTQLRIYVPTGEAIRGLGTDHASFEPALLYLETLSERLTLESEIAYWHPTSGSSTAGVSGTTGAAAPVPALEMEPAPSDQFYGAVIRYGVGLSYELYPKWGFVPVVELVGWSVRDGFATISNEGIPNPFRIAERAAGDSILNLKFGARIGPFYVGYGRALTGDVWYKQILRIEYRFVY